MGGMRGKGSGGAPATLGRGRRILIPMNRILAAALVLMLVAAGRMPTGLAHARQDAGDTREQPAAAADDAPPAPGQEDRALLPVLRRRLDFVLDALRGEPQRLQRLAFTEAFQARTTADEVRASVEELSEQLGGLTVLERRPLGANAIGAWIASNRDRRQRWTIRLSIEPIHPFRIDSLDFEVAPGPEAPKSEPPDFEALAAAEPFDVSLAIYELKNDNTLQVVKELHAERVMAIGTAGTLWTHLAMARFIAERGASWDDPLALDETLRTQPPSPTSKERGGTERQLATLANRAMQLNDNTAADHLLTWIGRERVEYEVAGLRGVGAAEVDPFLSIEQMFRLKCSPIDLLDRYAAADRSGRLALLDGEVASSRPDAMLVRAWTRPQQLDRVGWSASAAELARLGIELWTIASQAGNAPALESFRIAIAPGQRGPWRCIHAKQGIEPGALAELWIMERRDSRVFAFACVFNDTQRGVNSSRADAFVRAALRYLMDYE